MRPLEPALALAAPHGLESIGELIAAGKIKHYGLSNETTFGVCEFVRVVYVQDDSFNKVTRLSGVCIWSDLEAQEKPPAAARGSTRGSSAAASDQKVDGDALSQDAEAGTDMQDLKNIIREYLSQNACQYYPGRTPHSNPLKLSMIRLCRELVLYGDRKSVV